VAELFAIRRPQRGIPVSEQVHLRGLSFDELAQYLSDTLGAPRFRTEQVFRWLHRERVESFAAMTNVPARERALLEERARIPRLQLDTVANARDGTRKLRLRTEDDDAIESVLIPNEDRGYTQCISSQVGCALNCRFCATASLGFIRNLDTWEIVDQVYRASELLATEDEPRRVTNLVYMGMGEPLHNFNHVRRSLGILMHEHGAAISGKRITVSTSGLVPAIERFGREGLGHEVGLAISLNATTDAVRDEVMPINQRWNIETLLAAVRGVPLGRRRRITFEYVLLADVNDTIADARRLVKLVGDMRCHVNVIPFNPHEHAPYRRPRPEAVAGFMQVLRRASLPCWLRTPRGDDIGAACGQLALSDPKRRP
jgi:23S rRNA (adenine2503-C2)-methyltransferase